MKELEIIQSELISISDLESNVGQVPGLPANPRQIDDSRLSKLRKSIISSPEMMSMREILVFKYQGRNVVIGGNQRISALKGTKFKSVPCKIIPSSATVKQLKEYLIKDNIEFGSWVDEMLGSDWDMSELDDFGMEDLDTIDFSEPAAPSTIKSDARVIPVCNETSDSHETSVQEVSHKGIKDAAASKQQSPPANIERFFSKIEDWNSEARSIRLTISVPVELLDDNNTIGNIVQEFIALHPGLTIV